MTFDRFFKVSLLAILLGFLFVAWTMRENGRYIYHPGTEQGTSWIVIDSRTGVVFMFGTEVAELDPRTGKLVVHDVTIPKVSK
jgi:hypothetical protein